MRSGNRLGAGIAMLWLVLCLHPLAQAADSISLKQALVIGNQSYKGGHSLSNAINDASLMSKTLNSLGFTVTERHDLTREEIANTVNTFARNLPVNATALVYYAGHGMQIDGENFLNPVDLRLGSEGETRQSSYPMSYLLDSLSGKKPAVSIVVFDACRDNPFRRGGRAKYRSLSDLGLSRVDAPRGTVIAFSTGPGQVAADGTGRNSFYTKALAKAMLEPGVEIEQVFKKVANEVRKQTADEQIPWMESSIVGRYYLGSNVLSAPVSEPNSRVLPSAKSRSQYPRSGPIAPATEALWYRDMSAEEWSQLDWDIQQRVKHLTPDEVPMLVHKAGGGSVVAQTVLGLAYRDGLEKAMNSTTGRVTRFKANNTEAWRWLKKAAEAGFPVAQTEIGEMYYAAHGVDRSLSASRNWMERAAKAHYPRAKLDLLQISAETNPGAVNPADALESMFESMRVPTPRK